MICSITSSGLEMPPDQNASQTRSILLQLTRDHAAELSGSWSPVKATALAVSSRAARGSDGEPAHRSAANNDPRDCRLGA